MTDQLETTLAKLLDSILNNEAGSLRKDISSSLLSGDDAFQQLFESEDFDDATYTLKEFWRACKTVEQIGTDSITMGSITDVRVVFKHMWESCAYDIQHVLCARSSTREGIHILCRIFAHPTFEECFGTCAKSKFVEEIVCADRESNHLGMAGFFHNAHSALWPLIQSVSDKLFLCKLERKYDDIFEVDGRGASTVGALSRTDLGSFRKFVFAFYEEAVQDVKSTARHVCEAIRSDDLETCFDDICRMMNQMEEILLHDAFAVFSECERKEHVQDFLRINALAKELLRIGGRLMFRSSGPASFLIAPVPRWASPPTPVSSPQSINSKCSTGRTALQHLAQQQGYHVIFLLQAKTSGWETRVELQVTANKSDRVYAPVTHIGKTCRKKRDAEEPAAAIAVASLEEERQHNQIAPNVRLYGPFEMNGESFNSRDIRDLVSVVGDEKWAVRVAEEFGKEISWSQFDSFITRAATWLEEEEVGGPWLQRQNGQEQSGEHRDCQET